MLRAVLIAPEDKTGDELRATLNGYSRMVVQRELRHYPKAMELMRLLRACSPECLFVATTNLQSFRDVTALVEQEMPGLPVIAFGAKADPHILQQLIRIGIREFLAPPFAIAALHDAIGRVFEHQLNRPQRLAATEHLFTFVPAKAGVGASTLALQTSLVLANRLNIKTLLMDCDLGAGLQQWMLRLDNSYSLSEAVERASELDGDLWPQLVATSGSLDLLSAGKPNPNLRIDLVQLRQLLESARRRYRIICADLSANLERYALDLMAESKRIFLVTTPELPAVYLAGEKLRYLQSLDLGDRVHLLLNRAGSHDLLTSVQVERLLGVPIALQFCNAYDEVSSAIRESRPIRSRSNFGQGIDMLARSLAPDSAGARGNAPAVSATSGWRALNNLLGSRREDGTPPPLTP